MKTIEITRGGQWERNIEIHWTRDFDVQSVSYSDMQEWRVGYGGAPRRLDVKYYYVTPPPVSSLVMVHWGESHRGVHTTLAVCGLVNEIRAYKTTLILGISGRFSQDLDMLGRNCNLWALEAIRDYNADGIFLHIENFLDYTPTEAYVWRRWQDNGSYPGVYRLASEVTDPYDVAEITRQKVEQLGDVVRSRNGEFVKVGCEEWFRMIDNGDASAMGGFRVDRDAAKSWYGA